MLAQSVIDVILGEATHGTRAERYADMLAIASAVQNRAVASGKPADRIVADKREFNAYGKSLPSGVEKHRDLAEQAWNQVQTTGPIHAGMYYATPSAAKNLPGGLEKVATTSGHQFFSDPAGRSFRTADGFVKPDLDAIQTAGFVAPNNPMPGLGSEGRNFDFGGYGGLVPPTPVGLTDFALPDIAPAPSGRPAGPGLGALAPNGLRVDYSPLDAPGKGRSQVPSSGIAEKVAAAADSVVPGATTSVYSGMEPPGTSPLGTPDRHPRGFAGDFDFFAEDGTRITNPVAMHDIAMEMAAKHDANIGYGKKASGDWYMDEGRMHIDTMPLDQFPGGAQWASLAAGPWAGNLDFARATGIGPTPFTGAPTPTSRDEGLAIPESVSPSFESAGRGFTPPDVPSAPMAGPSFESGGRGHTPQSTGGLFDPIGALAMPSMPTEAPSMALAPDRAMPGGVLSPEISLPDFAPAPSAAQRGDPFAAGERIGSLAGIPSLPDIAPTPFSPSALAPDRQMPAGPIASPVNPNANLPAVPSTPGLLSPPTTPVGLMAPPVAVPAGPVSTAKSPQESRTERGGLKGAAKGAMLGGTIAGLPGAAVGGLIGGLAGKTQNPGPNQGLFGGRGFGPTGPGPVGFMNGIFDGLFGGFTGVGGSAGLGGLFGGGTGGGFGSGGWTGGSGWGGIAGRDGYDPTSSPG